MSSSRVAILISTASLLLGLAACGPSAEISGNVDGYSLSDAQSVFFGGPFIVIANEPLPCTDMSWVSRHYDVQAPPRDSDFSALQISFSNDEQVFEGQFSVAGNAQVTSKFLVLDEGAFTEYRGRGGMLHVTKVEEESMVEGNFDLTFDDGALQGDFKAEWCRNLKNR